MLVKTNLYKNILKVFYKPYYMSINIIKWNGRLGNNISQIINAIYVARHYNINKVIFPKHNVFKNNFINLNINNKTPINKKNYNDKFFSRKKICDKYDIDLSIFEKKIDNITQILKNIIVIDSSKINLTNNDLVIHIRSGDVYNSNPHHGWVQPPLIFYEKIINKKKWDKIIIICEDKKSPVIKPLLCKYNNIIFKVQLLEEDIKYIISCKNICFGMGSFIPSLLLLNENLINIYYPEYCYRYLLDLVSCNTKHVYKLENYIKCSEWKNTKEQIKIMLTYK